MWSTSFDAAWGGRLSASSTDSYEVIPSGYGQAFDSEPGGRRTVVITGRGTERYSPSHVVVRRQRLAFHERASFSPDRMAMWAVLLGIALVLDVSPTASAFATKRQHLLAQPMSFCISPGPPAGADALSARLHR